MMIDRGSVGVRIGRTDWRSRNGDPNIIATKRNSELSFNSSPPGQNGRHFAAAIFKCISMNEKFCIFIRISLKFVPKGQIESKLELVQVMAWRQTGDKPLPEPMLT